MTEACNWRREGWRISTDRSRLQIETARGFLRRSCWAPTLACGVVVRSTVSSLDLGLCEGGPPGIRVGFARGITDNATFTWVSDAFLAKPSRGRGLASWLMEMITSHPELGNLRIWVPAARDIQGLHRRAGSEPPADRDESMERKARR